MFLGKDAGIFEPIVHHRWEKLNFYSDTFSGTLNIVPYQYKMIRGIDLYDYVKTASLKHPNIEWLYEKVDSIQTENNSASVTIANKTFTGDCLFNSIVSNNITGSSVTAPKAEWNLLQHFKGYLIESPVPVFDATQATFMDFRVHQNHGTSFMYCLPVSPTVALVEYTLFTKSLLPQETYATALRDYITTFLKIGNYQILHEEYGIIPMTNQQFPLQDKRIVYMGIAGGQAKGSSGYAFQFIQKRTASIVQELMRGKTSFSRRAFADKKFHLYDSVLLNILSKNKMKGADIFARIFEKNPPERVLQFLDNESSLMDDLRIMQSVPASVFLPAALQELF